MTLQPPVYVNGKTGRSLILVGESLANLRQHTAGRTTVIITDKEVMRHWGHLLESMDTIVIGCGEQFKTLPTVEFIYDELIRRQADRSAFLVGVGGGIVCDITGFAASTYMRGIGFGLVPTSLLAQVDASVGGKTGVNHKGFKNMIGVFNQPEFVICDLEVLSSLPKDQIASGMAEIVKHATICDADMFAFLEANHQAAQSLDPDVLSRLIHRSVVIKAGVVNQDEKEAGPRRILNFGHTFGHAIEKCTGMYHGQAVSIGMVLAARLSQQLAGLDPSATGRLEDLLEYLSLPTRLPVPGEKIASAIFMDKKRKLDKIFFVLLQDIGKAGIHQIDINKLSIWLTQLS